MLGTALQRDHDHHADTSIGQGSQIVGTLKFEGTVRIDGKVEGEITAKESAIIGDTATVKAQVTADTIIITGQVTGDITANRRVEIRAPGQLHGNITTPSLVIHDGVIFEGQCSMGRATDQQKARRPVPPSPNGSAAVAQGGEA